MAQGFAPGATARPDITYETTVKVSMPADPAQGQEQLHHTGQARPEDHSPAGMSRPFRAAGWPDCGSLTCPDQFRPP